MLLYSATGGQWAYGSRITYSFVPDGTDIGGTPSALYQTMSRLGYSSADWQLQFSKAAAVWQSFANINLARVSDNGSPLGFNGDQQGDPGAGDIRIGGVGLSKSILAECFLPPAINGGTLAGDIVVNTSQIWHINSDFDLETVAIHEIGHALGMSHSVIASAVMYAGYTGIKQSLATDDIQGIQSIYGPQPLNGTNATYTKATDLTPALNSSGQVEVNSAHIVAASDSDWYQVTAPANTSGAMTVTMQSSNLSSLSPRFIVYNGSLSVRALASAPYTYGSTVTATITGVVPGQSFYIRALPANSGPGATGSYGLLVNFGTAAMGPVSPPYTTVAAQSDMAGFTMLETGGGDRRSAVLAGVAARLAGQLPDQAAALISIGSLVGWGEALTTRGVHALRHLHPRLLQHGLHPRALTHRAWHHQRAPHRT